MRGWVLMSASGRASKFLSAPMPKQSKKKKQALSYDTTFLLLVSREG